MRDWSALQANCSPRKGCDPATQSAWSDGLPELEPQPLHLPLLQARDSSFQSKAAAELALLVREQAKLEKDTGQALFLGLSLTDTLRACIRLGHNRAAAALRKQFSVPESRWYWLKLMSLCEAHDWEGLEEWAGERKASPIGWEPFLEKARQAGAPRDYLAR